MAVKVALALTQDLFMDNPSHKNETQPLLDIEDDVIQESTAQACVTSPMTTSPVSPFCTNQTFMKSDTIRKPEKKNSASSVNCTGMYPSHNYDHDLHHAEHHGVPLEPHNDHAQRKLVWAIIICFSFFLVELFAGLYAGSLAILSDSFHLLSDIIGFCISLFAIYLTRKPATKYHSWGYHRAEIIGAIMSTFLIWILTIGLVYEAIQRIKNPKTINGTVMFYTALCGVIVNIILGLTLHHDHSHGHSHSHDEENGHSHSHTHANINISAATLHVIGDLVSSIGVLISSVIILYYPEYQIVDPICTFVFSFIVLLTTVRLMGLSIDVLMEAVPWSLDLDAIVHSINEVKGVTGVHDIHVWNITIGKPAIAVHVDFTMEEYTDRGIMAILKDVEGVCAGFGILHCTIQMECHAVGIQGDITPQPKLVEGVLLNLE